MFDLRLVRQNHFKGIFRGKVCQQKCHKIVNHISFIALSKRIQVNSCLRKTKSEPLKHKRCASQKIKRPFIGAKQAYTIYFNSFYLMFKDHQGKLYCIIKKRGGEILTWKSIGRHPFHPSPGRDMIDCNLVRRVRV